MLISRATRSPRIPALAAALIILALGFSALPATSAHADDTDGISGAPADGSGADGRTRFSYQVSPGQQLDDNYLVKNTGTTAQTMTVFATDAFNTEAGEFGLLDTDAEPTDAGSWVTFADGATSLTIPLEPGESRVVPFTFTVPADARPGDHAAGIVISVTSASGQILVDRRVATRLYIRVLGDIQPLLTVTNISAVYNGELNPVTGETLVTFTIKNTGNVALGATMNIGVNTYFGIGVGPVVTQELEEMLPGSTRSLTIPLSGIGQLGYLDAYVTMQPKVDADAISPGFLAPVSRDAIIFAMPWWLLALVVIAGIVLVVLRIRRARDEQAAAEWIAYTEAEARRKAEDAAEAPELAGSTKP